jgi:ATP-dependent DNA ligase, homolog of eukaryotic ligase III
MEHKKFMDIQRIKAGYADGFRKGDIIYIEEKIDGANTAIRIDGDTGAIVAQSRKQILTPTNNLRGFYEFTQRLEVEKVSAALGSSRILFGEWLVPYAVCYPDSAYNNFYAFDVYDTETEAYLSQTEAIEIARQIGVDYVPIFYFGEFESWEHCMSFVGKTELGGEYGEGIVIKNQTRLNDPNGRQPFYLKIVGEQFAETKAHSHNKIKQTNADVLAKLEADKVLAETIVTEARVNKILLKLVDEGILPENWGAKEMGVVAKNLPREVYADCIKEEPEIVKQIDSFGKIANSIAMGIARTKI